MPVGTHGKIKVKKDGTSWMASCQFRDDGVVRKVRAWADTKDKAANKLREKLRDRKISSGEITRDSKVVEVGQKWLDEFRELVEQGVRSGTSLDTYVHRWETLVKPRWRG